MGCCVDQGFNGSEGMDKFLPRDVLVTIRPGGLGTTSGPKNLCRPLPAGGKDVILLSRTSQTSILILFINCLMLIPVPLLCQRLGDVSEEFLFPCALLYSDSWKPQKLDSRQLLFLPWESVGAWVLNRQIRKCINYKERKKLGKGLAELCDMGHRVKHVCQR